MDTMWETPDPTDKARAEWKKGKEEEEVAYLCFP